MSSTPDPLATALDAVAGHADRTTPSWSDVQQRAGVRPRRRRPRRVLLLAGAAVALAGGYAAAAAERYVPAPWQTDEATPDPTEEQALAHMAVFQAPATPDDALPPRLRAMAATLNPSSVTDRLLPGAPAVDASRLLYGTPGDHGVYAFPTSKGKVCVLGGQFGGGCVGGFDLGRTPVAPTWGGSTTAGWFAAGPAPDEVTSVEAVRPDGTRPAVIGRNFFVYTQPPGEPLPTSLLVRLADGRAVTMPTPTPTSAGSRHAGPDGHVRLTSPSRSVRRTRTPARARVSSVAAAGWP